MNDAIASARLMWAARSRRERILLLVLFALVAALVAWQGVVRPLQRAAANALAHYDRSVAEAVAIDAALRMLGASQSQKATPVLLAEFAETTAAAAGLTLAGRRVESAREITVRVDAAKAPVLFGWFRTLRESGAIVVTNVSATRNDDGTLRAEIRLAGEVP